MTKITADAELRAKLNDLTEFVELCDERGRTLGYFNPVVSPEDRKKPGIKSPLSDAELRELGRQPTGRPLTDILRDLEQS